MKEWGRKEVTSKFGFKIKKYKADLKRNRGGSDAESLQRYDEAKYMLHKVLDQREIFWRQRSKQLWLHAGDKNSRFFHNSTTNRRRSNQIHRHKSAEGEWMELDSGLQEVIIGYYRGLFTASDVEWEPVIESIDQVITREQNEFFCLKLQRQR